MVYSHFQTTPSQVAALHFKALQHYGENAMLQRGFVLARLEASLGLIEAELALPGAVGLPRGMVRSNLEELHRFVWDMQCLDIS